MQSTFLYCDKTEGTIEVTFSKREMAIENSVICADYKRIDTDVYEVEFFYGLKDLDIMKSLAKMTWNVEYNNIKGCVVDHIKQKLEEKGFRAMLRKSLREMKAATDIKSDHGWKVVKFYPEDKEVGFENIELSVEYSEKQANFYVKNRKGNMYLVKSIEFEEGQESRLSIINEIVKEQLVYGDLLKEFISKNDKEVDMLGDRLIELME